MGRGPVRLAATLDSVLGQGHDVHSALSRITRLHFDYSQVSKFDEKMKLLVPFWTFASRNLPLQVSQMWLKTRGCTSSTTRWSATSGTRTIPTSRTVPAGHQGAFTMGGSIGGDPLYLAPDLQHTRIQEQVQNFQDPSKLLSELNPLMRVPLETMVTKRKLYTGQQFSGTDEPADRELAPFIPLLGLLGTVVTQPAGWSAVGVGGIGVRPALTDPTDAAESPGCSPRPRMSSTPGACSRRCCGTSASRPTS